MQLPFPTDSLTSITTQPEEERAGDSTLVSVARGAAWSETGGRLCIRPRGTELPSSEANGTSLSLERLPFFLSPFSPF